MHEAYPVKIIAIANQKGGVGKSTAAVHLARYTASLGKTTLLVDFDKQRNASSLMQPKEQGGLVVSDLFHAQYDATRRPSMLMKHLSIIPADPGLLGIDSDESALSRPRKHLRGLQGFDWIVIDTPPSLGVLMVAALIAADGVLTPFVMDKWSLDGMGDLLGTIQKVRAHYGNPGLKHLGILANRVDTHSASQTAMLNELKRVMPGLLIPQVIKYRPSIGDALTRGEVVWDHAPGEKVSRAAPEMRRVCKSIFERITKRA
jgi:chromosome partitioning protein